MEKSFKIVFAILEAVEEYKVGNINLNTLHLIIQGAINLVEENKEKMYCNKCGLPVKK